MQRRGHPSPQQLTHNTFTFKTSETLLEAIVIPTQPFMIDPEELQGGRVQFPAMDRLFHCFKAELIGRTVA